MATKSTEGQLVKAIVEYLEFNGHRAVRVNSGATVLEYKGRRRAIRMAPAGTSDILACLKPTGKFMAVEAKRGKNKATEAQSEFLRAIERIGGIAVVAYSVDDVIRAIEEGGR